MLPLRAVILPVADVQASVAFYTEAFGWSVDFVDGDRWAQLDAGGTTVALAGPGGGLDEDRTALSIKVSDVAEVAGELSSAGQVAEGAHEVSVRVTDPDGHPTRIYAPCA